MKALGFGSVRVWRDSASTFFAGFLFGEYGARLGPVTVVFWRVRAGWFGHVSWRAGLGRLFWPLRYFWRRTYDGVGYR